ncbi:MAG: PKD domain-containing protein [Thermofilaceae archaeon]
MKRWAGLGATFLLWAFVAGLIFTIIWVLQGCGPVVSPKEEDPGLDFTLAVLADRRTVWVDATAFIERYGDKCKFYWDWGDGSGFVEGEPVEYHTYAQEGDYVVRLKVDIGQATGGGGGSEPGGVPGTGVGGGTSRYVWRAKRANLLDLGYPVPIVAILDLTGREPEDGIYLFHNILFDASRSYSPDNRPLWFRWEIVYVDPTTRQPAPYPFEGCVQCPTKPEYIKKEGARFILDWLPCGRCGYSAPWMYRVRCWVSDDYGRVRMWEGYIRVAC